MSTDTQAYSGNEHEGVDQPIPRYAWYGLSVLFCVYILNFIDRQILSILAEDVKRDLGLTDQDLGFLYGTAFGIFYSLFGIPLGRLADHWNRVRLLAIGLSIWSVMTTVSGLAKNGFNLAIARIGVGVGEATASPCAYSLLSDWFPASRRATALSIYSAGVFVGSGLSLFIGGLIVQNWNAVYPQGGPWGLTGWRVAFMAVGLPGLLMAAWVLTLREPARPDAAAGRVERFPWRILFEDMMAIVPPLTLLDAFRRGWRALGVNLAIIGLLILLVSALVAAGEPEMQWIALSVGVYAVSSWAISLRGRDPMTFSLVVASPAMVFTTISYGLISFLSYSVLFWSAPYAIRELGVEPAAAGFFVGGTGAAAGFLGVTLGGVASDWLLQRDSRGRLQVVLFGALAPVPFVLMAFTSSSLAILCVGIFGAIATSASALGAAGATVQDIVAPRMRGTAIAGFTIGTTLLGLALGPYVAGRISTLTGDLGFAMCCITLVAPLAAAAAIGARRNLEKAIIRRDSILVELAV